MTIRDKIFDEFHITIGAGKKTKKYNEMLYNVINFIDDMYPKLLDKKAK